MRRPRAHAHPRLPLLTLAMLLAVAIVPLTPVASAATTYSVAATLTPPTDGSDVALQVHTISYDATSPVRWTRFIPGGSTFVRALDEQGRPMAATVQDNQVVLETRDTGRHSFSLHFDTPVERHGPLLAIQADVSAAADSATRASISDEVTAAGYAIVGWRGSDHALFADDQVFRATGPMLASFLLAPPGVEDAGPDLRTSGRRVVREAFADVREDAVDVRTVLAYDTDTYGPDWTVSVPAAATGVSAQTPFGPVPCERSADELACTLPYAFGHNLGPRNFTLTYTLSAPSAYGGAFRAANVSISAAPDSYVTLNVTILDGWLHTGSRMGGAHEPEPLRYVAEGPLSVSVGLLPPPAEGEVRIEEGVFVLQVAEALAPRAQRVAAAATDLLPSAAGFVGGGSIDRPFVLAYTDAPVFQWEEGFYSPGYDTIAIRASELREESASGSDFVPVRTLVHETAHGLVSRHLPHKASGASFFDEGIARLAETHVEDAYADELFECEERADGSRSCTRRSARPEAEDVQAFHVRGAPLPLEWDADDVTATERAFLYDYSGYVFHAYERRAAPGALTHALNRISAGTPGTDEATGPFIERVIDALLIQAPDLPRDALLYPGRSVASLDEDAFAACLGPLAAPPYPWETLEPRPAKGCGDLDLTSAAGEPAPVPKERPLPEAPAPPPRLELPPAPDEQAEPGTSTGDGTAPGALVDAEGGAPVPLPAALVVLAVALAATGRRVRRD